MGWEISHCPTTISSFSSSAAIVAVWLVLMMGRTLLEDRCIWVVTENKKMADWIDRKNFWDALRWKRVERIRDGERMSRTFGSIYLETINVSKLLASWRGSNIWETHVRNALPTLIPLNSKFLWLLLRTSDWNWTKKPLMTSFLSGSIPFHSLCLPSKISNHSCLMTFVWPLEGNR